MPTGVQVWSETPVTNATADSNIAWPEGMAPSQVNDSARAMMASVAKWRDDNTGTLVTSGSSSALTVATNQVESALTTGFTFTATLGTAIGAAATIAVDSLAATSIFTSLSTASLVSTGQFAANQICSFLFSTGVGPGNGWVVKAASPTVVSSGAVAPFSPITTSLTSNVTLTTTLSSGTDGPICATVTGTSTAAVGTWFASGTVSVGDAGAIRLFYGKLWDGTTVIASGTCETFTAGAFSSLALSGTITNPSTNIKMSFYPAAVTGGNQLLLSNQSGANKDSTLTIYRIA